MIIKLRWLAEQLEGMREEVSEAYNLLKIENLLDVEEDLYRAVEDIGITIMKIEDNKPL